MEPRKQSLGGPAELTGITLDKNMMGSVCMILGMFFFWHCLQVLKLEKSRARRNELILCGGFLGMIGWLFNSVHSSTSAVSLLVGVAVILFLGLRFVNQRQIGTYLIVACVACGLGEWLFGVLETVVELLGKDPTLTDLERRCGTWF